MKCFGNSCTAPQKARQVISYHNRMSGSVRIALRIAPSNAQQSEGLVQKKHNMDQLHALLNIDCNFL
eukprot:jgi/Botrbrau1/10013/Bobra.0012s0100.1